ncbi:MAG: PIN domain-containing protein [Promethearchaeota archaeon]
MGKAICLDTGVIILHYSDDEPKKIATLMQQIKQGKIHAKILAPIYVEAYTKWSQKLNQDYAQITLASFKSKYPIEVIPIDDDIIFKAGQLKCNYCRKLSYNDCMLIALALNRKLVLHTTEKDLPKIPNLKVQVYQF